MAIAPSHSRRGIVAALAALASLMSAPAFAQAAKGEPITLGVSGPHSVSAR